MILIEKSMQQLPPEIFAISGKELIAKLKVRRDHLIDYAKEYYYFLAKQVEITGSKQREYFYVNTSDDGKTTVKVFRIDSTGKKSDTAFYSRNFNPAETKEIRLYGIDGEDVYIINAVIIAFIFAFLAARQKILLLKTAAPLKQIFMMMNTIFLKHTMLHCI